MTQVPQAAIDELTRYRTCVATLLAKLIAVTQELEARMNAASHAGARAHALLLRKARIHIYAILRANKTDNPHSLAVQMRPVLECAGQVVFIFHNLIIAPRLEMTPERAWRIVDDRQNAEYYRAVMGLTSGQVGLEQVLDELASMEEKITGKRGKRRKWKAPRQIDKVEKLVGGAAWYRYLSEYFCHGRAEWENGSWFGGVVSMKTVLDEFLFAGLMDCLTEQVAVMNAYAALSPAIEDEEHRLMKSTLAHRRKVREISRQACDTAVAALGMSDLVLPWRLGRD